jgi:F-type H+-transporting ATPase subunit gamma
MANLRDIKKRITSVTSTKQITRTMEMVATAKIRRATDRVVAATPYSDAMMRMLNNLAANAAEGSHPLLATHAEKKHVLFVVVASDRGLARSRPPSTPSRVWRSTTSCAARRPSATSPTEGSRRA